jgi:NodT family efflux transporter outer membrane factor (OMF) lipoprotein
MRFTLLASLLLTVACAPVGPDFVRPEAPVNPTWLDAELAQFKTSPASLAEWWEMLDDPLLNELIDTAIQNNNNVRIAGLRVIESQASLGIAIGNQYPQVQAVTGDASITDSNALTLEQYGLGAGLSWEIDFWGRFRRGVEAADANLLATIADYDDIMVLVTAGVADIYMIIRATEEQLRLARDSLELQQRSFEIVDVLFRNGSSSELDALQAKTLLLGTKATIPGLEITLQQSKNALSVLLGIPPSDLGRVFKGDGAPPDVPDAVDVGLPADLLRQRPDVRRAELQALAQNALVGVAEANLYPSFNLNGFLGVSSTDVDTGNSTIDDLFSSDSETFSVGASFVWPFWNYGRIRNNIRVQDARLQQALVAYQETVLQAARETEDAIASLIGARAQTEILTEGVTVAQRSADLAFLRYQEGFADYQRVLDAQQSLFTQQQRYASSRGEVARSLIRMYRSLGGGWQQSTPREFINDATREQMQERVNWGDLLENPPPNP